MKNSLKHRFQACWHVYDAINRFVSIFNMNHDSLLKNVLILSNLYNI